MVAALPLLREVIIREGITILHGHGVRGGGVEARVRDGEWKDGGVREVIVCVCPIITCFFMKQQLIINDHVTSIN